MTYTFSPYNYEIQDILITSDACYSKKELKQLTKCSEDTFTKISEWMEIEEEKEDQNPELLWIENALHERDLFQEVRKNTEKRIDLKFSHFVSKNKTVKVVHFMDSREQCNTQIMLGSKDEAFYTHRLMLLDETFYYCEKIKMINIFEDLSKFLIYQISQT